MVSVILNSFNQAKYLNAAIASVLKQSFHDLELLVVDNGSTDKSQAIAIAAAESDSRVRLMLCDDNASISQRFNQGIAQSCGQFIGFLYSDDLFIDTKLAAQIARFADLPEEFGVVYGPALGLNEVTGQTWRYSSPTATGDIFEHLMLCTKAKLDMVTPLVRRSCLEQHKFNESVFAEGEAIFHRIALTHYFAYLDTPLVILRDHGANAGKALLHNAAMVKTLANALRDDPHSAACHEHSIDRYEARVMAQYAWQAARLDIRATWVWARLGDAIRLSIRETLTARSAAAVLLSILPPSLRHALNRLGHTLRRAPGNAIAVSGYGGSTTPGQLPRQL